MTPHQRFRLGDEIEHLAVCQDDDGPPFSQLTDVQETFPNAVRFKLNGVTLNFLEDENRKKYEPKRIAHYPNDIIEVVCAAPSQVSFGYTSLAPSVGVGFPSQSPSMESTGLALSNLPLQSFSTSVNTRTLTRSATFSPQRSTTPFINSPNYAAHQSASVTLSAMPLFYTMATDISQLKQQLHQSTDQHSAHHQQLLQRLIQMELKQDEMLREQVESKLREEQMLVRQQETIDRLIVAQQRLEAIFTQNYELHEYPIPRLFVILPDSYEKWDPRNFMAERFRLYFLCECGDHCRADAGTTTSSGRLTIAAASTSTKSAPIPVKSTMHLAKHEGYELARPNEFFDRYGPYILGMLRVLKHCLAVATVVAPAVALAKDSVKDVMGDVKSLSESTMKAVDMSIDFLEQKLNDETVDGLAGSDGGLREEDMFERLAALEGADLRRLDTFLRNKDTDKILGNLYRITTKEGHVKWVCLDHYREVYRETAMASFLQCVETNGGKYDLQCGKATVILRSSTAAKDFFSRLCSQASFVIALKVALKWSFGSADLAMLVDAIAKSNVRDLEVDLQDFESSIPIVSQLRPGKGRYHSLLGLLSNIKIKGLSFANIDFIGSRTSNLPTKSSPSLLQSFHFLDVIRGSDDSRLANIISHCPCLVDLRLGKILGNSDDVPAIDQIIGSLSRLKTLHRFNLYSQSSSPSVPKSNASPYGSVALREIIDYGIPYSTGRSGPLEDALRRSSTTLEVLVLRSSYETPLLDLTYITDLPPSPTNASCMPFVGLTYLDLSVNMTQDSLEFMGSVLPRIPLVHLRLGARTSALLAHTNPRYLKSLFMESLDEDALNTFYCSVCSSPECHLEFMTVHTFSDPRYLTVLPALVGKLVLRRLVLMGRFDIKLDEALACLNFSQLQSLTIASQDYSWGSEAILASRASEFKDDFVVELTPLYLPSDVYDGESRDVEGSSTKLPRHRVQRVHNHDYWEDINLPFSLHYPSRNLE
ncbi:hypothetical protein BGZ95_001589 [Linnemannia exigua]|uniref:Uncharacterized protein n=1 Tax=Linnemannia exigua TaxID=604196 RepID=A0AAD4H4V7_9FUNG|nr:hypothetical protein BGZ95_001589 [Linnemannia exigua]